MLTPHAGEVTKHQILTGLSDRVTKFTELSDVCIDLASITRHFEIFVTVVAWKCDQPTRYKS